MISPWSKSVFYKTFPSTLAYVIICAQGFPFFFLYFTISFYLYLYFYFPYFVLVPSVLVATDAVLVSPPSGDTKVKCCYCLVIPSESVATTPPSKVLLYKTVLVPHCLIAIRNFVDLSRGLLCWYTVWCFFLSWCHRPRLRPIQ